MASLNKTKTINFSACTLSDPPSFEILFIKVKTWLAVHVDMDHGRNNVARDLPLGLSASSPQLNSFSSSSSISTGKAAAVGFAFPLRPAGIFKT